MYPSYNNAYQQQGAGATSTGVSAGAYQQQAAGTWPNAYNAHQYAQAMMGQQSTQATAANYAQQMAQYSQMQHQATQQAYGAAAQQQAAYGQQQYGQQQQTGTVAQQQGQAAGVTQPPSQASQQPGMPQQQGQAAGVTQPPSQASQQAGMPQQYGQTAGVTQPTGQAAQQYNQAAAMQQYNYAMQQYRQGGSTAQQYNQAGATQQYGQTAAGTQSPAAMKSYGQPASMAQQYGQVGATQQQNSGSNTQQQAGHTSQQHGQTASAQQYGKTEQSPQTKQQQQQQNNPMVQNNAWGQQQTSQAQQYGKTEQHPQAKQQQNNQMNPQMNHQMNQNNTWGQQQNYSWNQQNQQQGGQWNQQQVQQKQNQHGGNERSVPPNHQNNKQQMGMQSQQQGYNNQSSFNQQGQQRQGFNNQDSYNQQGQQRQNFNNQDSHKQKGQNQRFGGSNFQSNMNNRQPGYQQQQGQGYGNQGQQNKQGTGQQQSYQQQQNYNNQGPPNQQNNQEGFSRQQQNKNFQQQNFNNQAPQNQNNFNRGSAPAQQRRQPPSLMDQSPHVPKRLINVQGSNQSSQNGQKGQYQGNSNSQNSQYDSSGETRQWIRTAVKHNQGPKLPASQPEKPPLPTQPPPPPKAPQKPPGSYAPPPSLQTTSATPPSAPISLTTPAANTSNENPAGDPESLASLTEKLTTLETQIKTYQVDYQKWHQDFVKWQKQHQNHPDQKQYIEYQKKYQKMIEEQQTLLKQQYAELQKKIASKKSTKKLAGAAKIAAIMGKTKVENTSDSTPPTSINAVETQPTALPPAVTPAVNAVNAAPAVERPSTVKTPQPPTAIPQSVLPPRSNPPQSIIPPSSNPSNILLRSTIEYVGVRCRFFPKCKYGNTCKYEHDLCSSGKNCADPACPFEHPPDRDMNAVRVNQEQSSSSSGAQLLRPGPGEKPKIQPPGTPFALSSLLNQIGGNGNEIPTKKEYPKPIGVGGKADHPIPEVKVQDNKRKRELASLMNEMSDETVTKHPRPESPGSIAPSTSIDNVNTPLKPPVNEDRFEQRKREILGDGLYSEADPELERRKRELLGSKSSTPADEYERRRNEILGTRPPLERFEPPLDEYERRKREILGDPLLDRPRDYPQRSIIDQDRYERFPPEPRYLEPMRRDPLYPRSPQRDRFLDDPYYPRRDDRLDYGRPIEREIRSIDYGHQRVEEVFRDPLYDRRDDPAYLHRDRLPDPYDERRRIYDDRRDSLYDLPPRDLPPRDLPPRDLALRDLPPRDLALRDLPPRDLPLRDDRYRGRDELGPYERPIDPYSRLPPRIPYDRSIDSLERHHRSLDPYVRDPLERDAPPPRDRSRDSQSSAPSDYLKRIEERERERNERDGLRDFQMLYGRESRDSPVHSSRRGDNRIPESELKPEVISATDLFDIPGREHRPKNIVIILRGIPGSGKSHIAKIIKDKEAYYGAQPPRILALDDYFMQEVEVEEKLPGQSKAKKVKKQEFIFEADLEDAYRSSLLKAFNKTLSDGFFPMVIVDAINNKNKQFDQLWSDAKHKGFEVFIAEVEGDKSECAQRSLHKRPKEVIDQILNQWDKPPVYYKRLDVSALLQDAAIDDVEMEEATAEKEDEHNKVKREEEEDEALPTSFHIPTSKWETTKEETLAKLDGVMKRRAKGSSSPPIFPELDDEEDDPYGEREADMRLGKKRVRWADIEEKKQIDHQRKIGFSIGMDWNILTDPNAQIPR